MARIHIILQGFVDLNLETDENIGTTIGGSVIISSASFTPPSDGGGILDTIDSDGNPELGGEGFTADSGTIDFGGG